MYRTEQGERVRDGTRRTCTGRNKENVYGTEQGKRVQDGTRRTCTGRNKENVYMMEQRWERVQDKILDRVDVIWGEPQVRRPCDLMFLAPASFTCQLLQTNNLIVSSVSPKSNKLLIRFLLYSVGIETDFVYNKTYQRKPLICPVTSYIWQ